MVQIIFQKALDPKRELVLIIANLRKVFDSLPMATILKGMIDLKFS